MNTDRQGDKITTALYLIFMIHLAVSLHQYMCVSCIIYSECLNKQMCLATVWVGYEMKVQCAQRYTILVNMSEASGNDLVNFWREQESSAD